MRIFHIATVADWEAALLSGRYTTSTLGRTLAEEGFIHASRGDQWQGVLDRFYAGVTEPLLLLVLDTDLLISPVVEETVEGAPPGSETFPHVYGAITPDAVVRTIPLTPAPAPDPAPAVPAAVTDAAPVTDAVPEPSFSRIYFEELFRNLLVASLVLALVVAATLTGKALDDDWGPVTGAVLGLVVGVLVARRVAARRGS
ncbi:DUF952 domain-containing protein [Nocardioides dongxiaopingii]|uniref:DUF952 domain-containing protein n=1 Tax=Nocardioides sp. S-1144 TaxID=2582905 RepID=UPI00110D9EFD|nr:DUF952 domain-containing protein [Nocardioides sp. S-1144]QCW50547.1 DUF952 domain-containing protein [Nocardioides sp. S-1144]